MRAAVEVLAHGLKVRDALEIEDRLTALERALEGRSRGAQRDGSSTN